MPFMDPIGYGDPRQKRNPYGFQQPGMTPPFWDAEGGSEPPPLEPPPLNTPAPSPSMTAPPTLDTPKMPGYVEEAEGQSKDALARYAGIAATRPRMDDHGKKGFWHKLGDTLLNEQTMHPTFTRNTQEYERDLDAQGKVVKAAGSMADDARKRAAYESDLSRNQKQEALYGKQMETEERRQAELGKRKYQAVGSHGYVDEQGVFHPATPDDRQPSAAKMRQDASYRRTDLIAKKKAEGLSSEEQAELNRIEAYFKKEDADIDRAKSQVTLNLSGVTDRTAGGDLKVLTVEEKRNAQQVKEDTDYVLGMAQKLGTDPKAIAQNVMDTRYFKDWGDDQARRAAVVAEIQARENKKKTQKRNAFQSVAPLPSATPAAKPVAMAPPASIEKQVAEGGIAKGPDGSVWVKKNGVMIQQGSENA